MLEVSSNLMFDQDNEFDLRFDHDNEFDLMLDQESFIFLFSGSTVLNEER